MNLKLVTTIFGILFMFSTSYAADPYGLWKRPNGSVAKVWNCGGKMCGKVVAGTKAGFVMFTGINQVSTTVWKGNMKHPKMGKLFTFNGTVTMSGNTLLVKGCMIGGMMCDAETWTK